MKGGREMESTTANAILFHFLNCYQGKDSKLNFVLEWSDLETPICYTRIDFHVDQAVNHSIKKCITHDSTSS